MEYNLSPDQIINEIETKYEIREMLAAGLSRKSIVELLRYQGSLLLLCAAVNPYLSENNDFHPIIALMELADKIKRNPAGPAMISSVADTILEDDDQIMQVAEEIIEELRSTEINSVEMYGLDPLDPKGVDYSFTNAVTITTKMAMVNLPSRLLVAEIGKIVIPALTKLNAQLNSNDDGKAN